MAEHGAVFPAGTISPLAAARRKEYRDGEEGANTMDAGANANGGIRGPGGGTAKSTVGTAGTTGGGGGAGGAGGAGTAAGGGSGRKRSRDSVSAGVGGDRKPEPRDKDRDKDSKEPPSILVREKKQKACANCRRAKLKCIVENNESDCVRCRARKEKCVFYPRGHDEDWQQTLTSDVYSALGHLSQLSAAVHHLVSHLTVQGIIPPLDPPLARYEVPDRDLSALQGWGVERNRELGGDKDGPRKRSRRGKKEDSADEDDAPVPGVMFAGGGLVPSSSGVVRPADMHIPQPFERKGVADGISLVPLTHPSTASSNNLSLGDVDMSAFSYGTGDTGAGPGSYPSATGVTPDNMLSISPTDSTAMGVGALDGHSSYPNQLGGIFGLLNGSRPAPSPNSVAIAQTNLSDSLGAQDPRPNIVKRGLLPNSEALSLVKYFHAKLSPWLYGYRLEFGKFPYIALGPSSITPFILSVLCLVAAERVPSSHERRNVLAREVTQLLVNSPADSFISTLDPPFGGGTGQKDEDGEEELDPELGIGPEEIVGACVLATFMTERDQAATIASSAFKWARGWIKWTSLTVPLPPTLGEVCGLLPIKRDATREDMARVWLLCYIVDGTEALQRDNPPPPRRDPMAYCHVLVPDSPIPGDQYSPNDILLTFHARLITLLRDWYHRRSQHELTSAAQAGLQAAANARLASSINASLEWWRADLDSHALDPNQMRYINLFWEFARMLVNATSAKSLDGNPRLRSASWAHGVEAAVGFLEKCNAWPQRNELANLPPCYLSMITLAGSVLVDAIKDQGAAECPFQAGEAVPLLNEVADMLASSGLPPSHVARTAGQTLRQYSEQLAQFI